MTTEPRAEYALDREVRREGSAQDACLTALRKRPATSGTPQPIFHHPGQALKSDVVNVFRIETFIIPILVARDYATGVQVQMVVQPLRRERDEAIGVEDCAAIIRPAPAIIFVEAPDELHRVNPGPKPPSEIA